MSKKLTVAIDARWIFPRLSGVGVYARNLIRHISLLDDRNSYILLFHDPMLMEREVTETGAAERRNLTPLLVPYSVFSLRNQVELPGKLTRLGVDVFHSPNFMIPLRGLSVKTVLTIHDLIPLLFPYYTRRSKKRMVFPLYKRIMWRVVRSADAIMADSDSTRNDILRTLPASADKVHRVYLGVDEMFSPGPSTGEIRRKFGISGKLLLCVGRQDPYKNVLAAVKALALVLEQKEDLDCHMLIVGEKDLRYPEVSQFISRKRLSARVIMTDYLSGADLVAAYREADLLVHLSLYEGFGLPPLEAMACGTPVLSSDRSSLPEVLGDAPLFTNPHDVYDSAAKIIAALSNENLRRRLVARGKEQAAKYNWHDTARQVNSLYRKVAAGG